MKSALKYLRINRAFEFPGPIEELMERIAFLCDTQKRFITRQLGNNAYKIEAKVSLGTARISGVGIPIGVWMDIKDNETLNPTVLISSEARGEHFFLVVIFGVMLVITALSNEPWYLPLFVFGLFFVVHFWFHLVYRAQENELINQIKGQLKLQESNL